MENPMLLEAGLQQGLKGKKRGAPCKYMTWNADMMKS